MKPGKNKLAPFARKSCVAATQMALALMALQAQAQTAPGSERIEVTGSRIPLQQNVESTSPVAIISAEDIRLEGQRNTESLLNNMPQVFAQYGSSISNGATGTATVNLRGLGASRTLVLVNGRRLPAGSPLFYPADLNSIPAPLINRVEILTGGASAIYGSDAISGVVNFILKQNFEGVQAEVNYSGYQHSQSNPNGVANLVAGRAATNPAQFNVPGDKSSLGESTDASILIGGNFGGGKGNATVFWGYKHDKPIVQADYDYSSCSLNGGAAFVCGGSSTGFPGRFIPLGGPNNNRQFTVADAAGNPRAFVAATDQFNFAPYNYYQRPSDRYTAHATAHYEVSPMLRPYIDFGFHDDHTVAQIAPSGIFGVIYTFRGDNPLLTPAFRTALGLATNTAASSRDVIVQRRNIEGGGRQADLRHTSFRTSGGVKGEIKGWDYDIYAQTAQVIYQQIYRNEFSVSRAGRALDVVTDPATGAAVCRSALSGEDPTCVPYNPFRLGGVTAAALNYVQTPGLQKGFTSQTVQGAQLTGDLGNYGMKLPGARNGIGIAGGIERRVEKLQLEVDSAFDSGDLAGQGGPTHGVNGKYTVKEAFVEARVPIIEGRGIDLLSLNASYRYSDYSTGQTTDSFGVGVEFAPIKMVKMRGSYQEAVRAANIIELFTPQGLGLFGMDNDPCAGPNPTATLAACQRTGVTAAQYRNILDNPAGQYNSIGGGNPNLRPEQAKTYTLGLVLQPRKNLTATIDYFNIKVEDVISNIAPDFIVGQCLSSSRFCDLIRRDSLGTLWLLPTAGVTATNINLAKLKTSGFDIAASYTHALGRMGGVNLNFSGTFLKEAVVENVPGLGSYDCVGYYANPCGTPTPEWRHRLRVTWNMPWNLDASLSWRYFDSVQHKGLSSNPLLAGTVSATDRELAERHYFDLAAVYAVTKQITVRGGVNNIFDKDPPIVSSTAAAAPFGNGNTYPQVYDALGRKFFVAATVKF